MADAIFASFKEYMADGTIDLDTHTFKCCLLTAAYTPAPYTHTMYSDLTNELASTPVTTGYTAGGVTLGTVTWTRSGGTVTLDAVDAIWTSATFTARFAVIYDDSVTTIATDALVCIFDFAANKSVSAGTFTLQFNASGIIALT